MVNVPCPSCKKVHLAPDNAIGRRVRCNDCGAAFVAKRAGPGDAQRPNAGDAEPCLSGPTARKIARGVIETVRKMLGASGTGLIGIVALCLGFLGCLGCWIQPLWLAALVLASIGLALGLGGIAVAFVGGRKGFVLPVLGAALCLAGVIMGAAFRSSSGDSYLVGSSRGNGATEGSAYSVDVDYEVFGVRGGRGIVATVKGPAARLAVIVTDPKGESDVRIIERDHMITNRCTQRFPFLPWTGGWVLGVKTFDPEKIVWEKELRSFEKEAQSIANLANIGKGIAVYLGSHNDRWPPDLAALIDDRRATGILVSPLSGRPPPEFDKGKKALVGEVDYIYIPLDSAANSGLICAYERLENYKSKGTHVLYQDLHVGGMDMESFEALLKQTKAYVAARAGRRGRP